MKTTIAGFVQSLKSTTARLALSYLAIIMAMSAGFSCVFYYTSSHELGRQVPPDSAWGSSYVQTWPASDYDYKGFFERRITEGRGDLLGKLIILNMLTLAAGAFLSYYLARRTLQPIEHAMEAQSRFASDASHELRTPLTVIQTENEVALRSSGLTLAHAKNLLRSNLEEVMRLRDLSDGLLRLARGDQTIQVQPVWLDDIARDAMNRVISAAQAKDITIEDTVPHVRIEADPASLAQVLVILLDNAIKYSAKHARVNLTGAGGKVASVSVRDNGPGIAAEHLPHIFDRFYRVDQARSKQAASGYGLGLAIARKIIEQHGGSIHVKSTVGKGSVFTMRLPRAS
ncbi:MAG TPA: HAMP domain-containing sensor histidine kinase [Candidatus Saccharimonadales bacterium]|nr:HAMP domain-containing sensor histidine kinase [Candidatus Saccharimonadales bacterium]